MLIALIVGACAIALLPALRRGQVSDLRRYGVTRQMHADTQHIEPDVDAPEPEIEEFSSC